MKRDYVKPTGRAVRWHDGYGLYHCETAWPNGDLDVACRDAGPHFGGAQFHPDGWTGAVDTMPTGAVCRECALLIDVEAMR